MTFDPRQDVIESCNINDITFTDDNNNTVSINLTYEDNNDMDEVPQPLFVIRQVRPVKRPTSVGWNTYQRTVEFDVSFYMLDSDNVTVREDKKEVLDAFETKIENNQSSVTAADNVKIISVRPQSDYDQKQNIFGWTATLEAIDKD
jgi:hypothetical protein